MGQVKGKLQGRVITSLNSGLESFLHLMHLRLNIKEQSGTRNLHNGPLEDFFCRFFRRRHKCHSSLTLDWAKWQCFDHISKSFHFRDNIKFKRNWSNLSNSKLLLKVLYKTPPLSETQRHKKVQLSGQSANIVICDIYRVFFLTGTPP